MPALLKRWRFATVVTLTCVCCAAGITSLLPHHYESEMEFLVNHERADLVISPGQDQATMSPPGVDESEVNSEIELLKSQDILKRVVVDRKLYLPFQHDKSAPPSSRSVELATLQLSKALTVAPVRKTNVINVAYRGNDPIGAVGVLQDVGDRYLASHLVAHSAPGTDKFFSEQVARYGEKLTEVRSAIAAFDAREQIFSMPEQRSALVARLEGLSSQLADVTSQIRVQQSRLQETGRQLSARPERIVTQVKQTPDQSALEQLEATQAQLENHRIELTTKFKGNDRLVVEADQQIANTHQEIARLRADRLTEETTDLDPVHQAMAADSSKGSIDLQGLETERLSLEQMRRDCVNHLQKMDGASQELATLQQYEKDAEDNYSLYNHRLEEARLAGALDRDKLSNVVMIERPFASPISVSPNLPLNMALGLLLGLALSFGPGIVRMLRQGNPPLRPAGTSGLYRPESVFHPVSGD